MQRDGPGDRTRTAHKGGQTRCRWGGGNASAGDAAKGVRSAAPPPTHSAEGWADVEIRTEDPRILRFHQICTNKEHCVGRSDINSKPPQLHQMVMLPDRAFRELCQHIWALNILAQMHSREESGLIQWCCPRGARLGIRLHSDCHVGRPRASQYPCTTR